MFPNLYRLFNGFALSNIDFSQSSEAEVRETTEAFRENYNAILEGFSARRIAEFETELNDPEIFKASVDYLNAYDSFYNSSKFESEPTQQRERLTARGATGVDILRKYVENTF